jgi:trigger factor
MPDKPRPEGHPVPTPSAHEETLAAQSVHGAAVPGEGPEHIHAHTEMPTEAMAAATAVAEVPEEEDEKKPEPLNQQVDITDAGPCRKHIKVTIPAEDIHKRLEEKFSEMRTDAQLPGFRPGKVPRKLLEKKFFKDVCEQLKAELLLQSLEQMAEDHKLNPIAQPNIDPFKIELPKEGPLNYEFEIEVAPEFELPQYKGLVLKRPVRDITEADVDRALKIVLRNYGELEPKDGAAETEDYLLCTVKISKADKQLSKFDNLSVRVDRQLAFKDGVVKDFDAHMKGVKAGDERTCDVHLSQNIGEESLRGQVVQAEFHVKEVRKMKLPELNHEFLHRFGLHTPDQFREKVRGLMLRQLEYEQRQAAREQVLRHFAGAANLDLPRDLLVRQAKKTLNRRVLELRQAGYPEEHIRSRANLLQQNALAETEQSLKEHFVLQKIAEAEKLEVSDDDINFEIETIADQSDETPRRVRARLEKDDLMDSLASQILERKALDLVLESAEYEDVKKAAEEAPVAAVEEQAIPGAQPELEPPAEEKQEE